MTTKRLKSKQRNSHHKRMKKSLRTIQGKANKNISVTMQKKGKLFSACCQD
jgi:hypothetical protein